MEYPRVRPKPKQTDAVPGVYVSLDDLIRLQFRAQDFTFLPRQPVHSLLSGKHASRIRGRGLNFEEIRGYLQGDDVRSIDWKVTARMRKPHVRVFTEERDRPALLLVDQRISMFYGTRTNMKSVTAAEAAALAAWRVVGQGDRVGALVFNDTEMKEIRPLRSKQKVMQILEAVVTMNRALGADAPVESNPGMLNEVLHSACRLAKHDYLVGIISDFDGADEETRRAVMRLSHHNDVLALVIHDPTATELPPSIDLVVSDGDLQIELEMGKEKVRKRISDYSSGRIADILDWQREFGVPVLPISAAEDVAMQVRHLLGQRLQAKRP